MAGKYGPLRDYLAARDKGEVRLSLSFDAVGRLVGGLPPSATSRETWWANTAAARGQARAWQDAGWLVESVDPSAGFVVFARSPAGTPPGPAGPAPAAGPATAAGGQPAPAATPEPGKHASWRSMRSDLAAGGVAALSGGVAAIISLNHLPWLAIVLLSVSVFAVAFAITHALASRDAAEKWWSLAMSLVLATAAGAFVYHEELDPAMRPASLPFTVAVSVDPQNPVMPEECRQVVLPGPWRAPAPPTSVTQQAINSWEQAQDGVDGAGTYVTIILQGTSDQAVTINAPQVVITSRQRPLNGPVAGMSEGCGAELRVRQFTIDLDQKQPVATFQDGTGLPAVPSASGAIEQAQAPVFTISDTDPEYFVVDATTARNLVRWYLKLNWQSMGRSGTLPISDGSAPFATSAVNPAGHAFYFLRPGGTWSGPS